MNSSLTTNYKKTLSIFDIVLNIGIGVNVEGLARVIPSSFSEELRKKTYIHLMKVRPNYKLPSFRLGITEVVTAVAHAAVASFFLAAKNITVKFLQKNPLLNVLSNSVAPGWTNAFGVSFSTVSSQSSSFGRMVYDSSSVKKQSQFFLDTGVFKTTTLCAAGL